MKLKVFVLKVATIDPFSERNVITKMDFQMAQCQGPRVYNDGKTFLVSCLEWW